MSTYNLLLWQKVNMFFFCLCRKHPPHPACCCPLYYRGPEKVHLQNTKKVASCKATIHRSL